MAREEGCEWYQSIGLLILYILLNFNMWECRMKKKIPCIATVRSEFFYLFNNVVSNSSKLSELAAHSNVSACRRWRAGEHGRG
jgi:hypothetical protein